MTGRTEITESHSQRTVQIMGILNVTPDSFSDGGKYIETDRAVQHAMKLIEDGADMIDVGPESTRPESQPVSSEEQIRRAIPVIQSIRKANRTIAISIDTQCAKVARAALHAGANIVNDISALRNDPEMASVVTESKCRVVLMHMQGTPATMQHDPAYDDVVAESISFLRQRCEFAARADIDPNNIIVDPGIGFGKTTQHNLAIMRRLTEYQSLGREVLLGASRKRFLEEIMPGETRPEERLAGSLACVARALHAGVKIVRVHDVAETLQFITSYQAIG